MGLDTTHGAWHGPYSSFMSWRKVVAQIAGFPPLELMEGYYQAKGHNPFTLLDYAYPKGDEIDMAALRRVQTELPIKWILFRKHPLYTLLTHSDCDGYINWKECKKISISLQEVLDKLKTMENMGYYIEKTENFIEGLNLAYESKERLEFH